MFRRRDLLKMTGMATAAALVSRHSLAAEIASGADPAFHFLSGSLDLQVSATAPEFLSLNIDGMGKARRGANIVTQRVRRRLEVVHIHVGRRRRIEYRSTLASDDSAPTWTFEFSESKMVLTSQWSADFAPLR